jgi:hypothetical protein
MERALEGLQKLHSTKAEEAKFEASTAGEESSSLPAKSLHQKRDLLAGRRK